MIYAVGLGLSTTFTFHMMSCMGRGKYTYVRDLTLDNGTKIHLYASRRDDIVD